MIPNPPTFLGPQWICVHQAGTTVDLYFDNRRATMDCITDGGSYIEPMAFTAYETELEFVDLNNAFPATTIGMVQVGQYRRAASRMIIGIAFFATAVFFVWQGAVTAMVGAECLADHRAVDQ